MKRDKESICPARKGGTSVEKQQLPETKFFYALAMKRSAEIKSQGEQSQRSADQPVGEKVGEILAE